MLCEKTIRGQMWKSVAKSEIVLLVWTEDKESVFLFSLLADTHCFFGAYTLLLMDMRKTNPKGSSYEVIGLIEGSAPEIYH